jgi:IS30 family transposase
VHLLTVEHGNPKRIRQHKKVLGASIEQRPAHIDDREEFGHWEVDTVLGSRAKGAVLTLTERKTRHEHILKIDQKTAKCVKQAFQTLKRSYGSTFSKVLKTVTADNDSEFSELSHALNPINKYITPILTLHPKGEQMNVTTV